MSFYLTVILTPMVTMSLMMTPFIAMTRMMRIATTMKTMMMMMMMMATTMKTQPESEVGSWCAVLPAAIQESLAIHWYTHSLTRPCRQNFTIYLPVRNILLKIHLNDIYPLAIHTDILTHSITFVDKTLQYTCWSETYSYTSMYAICYFKQKNTTRLSYTDILTIYYSHTKLQNLLFWSVHFLPKILTPRFTHCFRQFVKTEIIFSFSDVWVCWQYIGFKLFVQARWT